MLQSANFYLLQQREQPKEVACLFCLPGRIRIWFDKGVVIVDLAVWECELTDRQAYLCRMS